MPPFKWEWDTNLQPRLGFILSQVIDGIYLRLAISIVCYFCTSSLSLWLLIVCLCFHYVYTFSHLLCLCCFWLSVFAFLAPTFEQLFCFYYCCLSLSLWYIIYWLHLHVFLVSYFWSFYLLRLHIFSVYAASDQMSVLFHLLRLNNFSASIIASISFACFYIFSVYITADCLSLLQLNLYVSVYITAGCLSLLSATFAHLLSFNWSPRIYRFLFLQPSSHFVWLTINLLELASSLTDDIFSACFTTSLALSLSHSHTNTIHSQLTNHRWGASSVIAFKSTHKSIRLTTYRNTSTM